MSLDPIYTADVVKEALKTVARHLPAAVIAEERFKVLVSPLAHTEAINYNAQTITLPAFLFTGKKQRDVEVVKGALFHALAHYDIAPTPEYNAVWHLTVARTLRQRYPDLEREKRRLFAHSAINWACDHTVDTWGGYSSDVRGGVTQFDLAVFQQNIRVVMQQLVKVARKARGQLVKDFVQKVEKDGLPRALEWLCEKLHDKSIPEGERRYAYLLSHIAHQAALYALCSTREADAVIQMWAERNPVLRTVFKAYRRTFQRMLYGQRPLNAALRIANFYARYLARHYLPEDEEAVKQGSQHPITTPQQASPLPLPPSATVGGGIAPVDAEDEDAEMLDAAEEDVQQAEESAQVSVDVKVEKDEKTGEVKLKLRVSATDVDEEELPEEEIIVPPQKVEAEIEVVEPLHPVLSRFNLPRELRWITRRENYERLLTGRVPRTTLRQIHHVANKYKISREVLLRRLRIAAAYQIACDVLAELGELGAGKAEREDRTGEFVTYRAYEAGDSLTQAEVFSLAGYLWGAFDEQSVRIERRVRREQKLNVVFFFDVSGSMMGDKIRAAKVVAAALTVWACRNNYRVAVVPFTDAVKQYTTLKQEMEDHLDLICRTRAWGGTSLQNAMLAASEKEGELVDRNTPTLYVVVGDMETWGNAVYKGRVYDLVASARHLLENSHPQSRIVIYHISECGEGRREIEALRAALGDIVQVNVVERLDALPEAVFLQVRDFEQEVAEQQPAS